MKNHLKSATFVRPRSRLTGHLVLVVLMVAVIGILFVRGLAYELKPASVEVARATFPAGTPLATGEAGTIVLFLHPKCPCSRASVAQLDRLLTMAPDKHVAVHVVFVGEQADEPTSLVQAAQALKGVEVSFDPQHHLAKLFGASVSGETFAFDKDRRLIFHGGLTPSRGHEGDSYALSALANWLETGATPDASGRNQTPTFGCTL